MSASFVSDLISSMRFRYNSEAELQELISEVLSRHEIAHAREFICGGSDRLDFLVNPDIAMEVKIDGSRNEVLRQLHRYAQIETIRAIVLVTSKACHLNMPETLNGKPVYVASLLGGAF